MAFWNKKKKNEKKSEEIKAATPAPAKATPEKPAAPVKPAPAKAPSGIKPAPAKAPAGVRVAPEPKTPAKAPAKTSAKASTKAPAKTTATKTAAPKAVKVTSEPAGVTSRTTAGRPFFAVTEEDIRLAFDMAIADAEAEIERSGSKVVGKYEFNLEVDGYHFYLIANNGQVLFDSPSFTTLLGALNGIKTFKKTVATSEFDIKVDKYKRYRFILANKYYGENYTTKDQCQKCADSVRKFAHCSKILPYTPDKEALAAFELAKISKRSPDDIDWNAIAKAEATAQKKGKFEICQEGEKEFCFYLLASNGQILYASRFYASETACRKGVESFKRAAYVGNFFVDRDKFGNYRYVLKNIGSAPSFIGESYDNKPQCEKIIESVKNFIVTATIEKETAENA